MGATTPVSMRRLDHAHQAAARPKAIAEATHQKGLCPRPGAKHHILVFPSVLANSRPRIGCAGSPRQVIDYNSFRRVVGSRMRTAVDGGGTILGVLIRSENGMSLSMQVAEDCGNGLLDCCILLAMICRP